MARGWESKSVEAQQDAADATRRSPAKPNPDETARRSRRALLQLTRARAHADLQAATVDAHRAMLERAIAELDQQIAALG